MKKIPSKAELRAELQKQIDDYLMQGGEVRQIPSGVSGRDNPMQSLPTPIFNESKITRTPIPEVLEALDSRRQKKPEVKKPAKKKPVEKVIYDDFGEPLRKVWVDS